MRAASSPQTTTTTTTTSITQDQIPDKTYVDPKQTA